MKLYKCMVCGLESTKDFCPVCKMRVCTEVSQYYMGRCRVCGDIHLIVKGNEGQCGKG